MSGSRTLAGLGEWGLLKKILPRLPGASDPRVIVGPGDDAAVFRGAPGTAAWVLTTDMLVEGVHFDLRWTSAEDLGWKSLAVNLSDLAAMGPVRPAVGVVALGMPPRTRASFVDGFYRGLGRLARAHGFSVVGGDTVRSESVVVSIAVLGEAAKGARLLQRKGARPGDVLMVTGTLGDAAGGLAVLRGGRPRTATEKSLARRLLRPVPRLDLSARIAAVPGVTAMMDSSDGLWRSAVILAGASGVGFRIEAERLPLSAALRARFPRPRDLALAGGEDYELVLTARPSAAALLQSRGWARAVGRAAPRAEGVRAYDEGRPRRVPREFEHFG